MRFNVPLPRFVRSDLFRSFAIGFGAGALIVAAATGIATGDELARGVVPAASAAAAQ